MASDYRQKCLTAKGAECHFCDGTENIVAHHINGDRTDNRLENLIPTCRSCHAKVHSGAEGFEEWTAELPDSALIYEKNFRNTISFYIDAELEAKLAAYRDRHEYSPTTSKIVRYALREFLDERLPDE